MTSCGWLAVASSPTKRSPSTSTSHCRTSATNEGYIPDMSSISRYSRSLSLFLATMMAIILPMTFGGAVMADAANTSVAMTNPGPMAVTSTGVLYVASGRELFRLDGRTFTPVARAARVIRCAVASSDGSIFIGETGILQRVMPDGAISTVIHVGLTGVGQGPHGSIYVVTNGMIDRLVGRRLVPVIRAAQFVGLARVPSNPSEIGFANVAIDASGTTYITAGGVGNSLFEVTSRGRARYLSPARSAHGIPSSLTTGSDGRVFLGVQNAILWVSQGRIGVYLSFSEGAVKGFSGTFAPSYVAASTYPRSPLYADATGNGFSNDRGVIAIYPDHSIAVLWVHR